MHSNTRLANTALTLWVMAFSWALPHAVHAATLTNDLRTYDYESLLWAGVMSIFGGTLRTIFSLATDDRVINSVVHELWKDVVVAMIAGMLVYILLEAAHASELIGVPSEARFALIVFAGWSRMSFFGRLNQLGGQFIDAIGDRIGRVVGGGSAAYRPPAATEQTPGAPATPPAKVEKAPPFKRG